jgi:hypothetical protein
MSEGSEKNPKVTSLQEYKNQQEDSRSRFVSLSPIEEEALDYRAVGFTPDGIYLLTYPSQNEGIILSPAIARTVGLALIEAATEWRFSHGGEATDEDE